MVGTGAIARRQLRRRMTGFHCPLPAYSIRNQHGGNPDAALRIGVG